MLEFGNAPAETTPNDLIKDTTEAEFLADVVEMSQTIPVIVDFWAPWCGPCKTLGPALESAVTAAKGAVKMVKVNVDENQGIAGQLQIQSIPTVYAFWKGQPADGFQGAITPAEITAFVKKIAELGDGAPEEEGAGLDEAVEAAEAMLTEGAAVDAAQTFAAILGEDPNHAGALGGLARAHLALGEVAQADGILSTAPDEIFNAPELESVRAQIALAKQAENVGPVAELTATVEANPDDHQARLDLATALHAEGDVEGAISALLDSIRRDMEWNEGAAKAQLFTVFDAMKPQDPIVLKGRRKLSSILFA
jgi:putative thioredoxin